MSHYVSNVALIITAIELGLKIRSFDDPHNPNLMIGVLKPSVKRIVESIEALERRPKAKIVAFPCRRD